MSIYDVKEERKKIYVTEADGFWFQYIDILSIKGRLDTFKWLSNRDKQFERNLKSWRADQYYQWDLTQKTSVSFASFDG